MPHRKQESGFTLVELLVVIIIITILFALSTVNLGQAQTTASLQSITNTLLADIKNQQLLAMVGEEGSTSSQQPHGIYIEAHSYVLFADASYTSSDSNNFTVQTGSDTVTTTFPGSQVVFTTGEGGVASFSAGNNTITIAGNGSSQTITINRFGATAVQ